MKKLFIFISLYFGFSTITSVHAQTFESKSHTNASIASYSMPYRLFIPANYNPNNSYPLVLFLHGAGERGTDNNAQLTANKGATLWAETANQATHPCFVVAPQCPAGKQWVNTDWGNGSYSIDKVPMSNELKMVKNIIETLQTQYNIDASRLFIDGLSMGGYGTWDFILRYPTMFRAAIPMCGAGDPTKASLISTLPLWVFHSNDDAAVPVVGSRDMVNAINALGFNNRSQFYSEYLNKGHVSAYESALAEPNLVNWLFNTAPATITTGLVDVTKFAGTCSAQGGDATGAFDNAIYTNWLDLATNYPSTRSSWVQYHFSGGSYIVTSYSITSSYDFFERNPRDWNLLGSNVGVNWSVLDTRINEVFSNSFQKNIYSFNNITAFSYYKLQINSVYKPSDANCLQLAEIRLWMKCDNVIPVTGITLSPITTFLDINTTQQLLATVAPNNATNKTMIWNSSNPIIATISANGLITAIGAGNTTITATTQDGNKVATCTVTVTNPNEVTKLTGVQSDNIVPTCCGNGGSNAFDGDITTYVDDKEPTGGYTQLDFGGPKNVTTIKYYPRVDNANKMIGGTFLGSNDGTNFTTIYTINASPAYDWNSVTANVNYRYIRYLGPTNGYCNVAEIVCFDAVTVSVKGIAVNLTTAAIAINATRQLTATVSPNNATNKILKWSSSEPGIATVSPTGLVSTLSSGTAIITVTTQDQGKTASCAINSFTCINSKLTGVQFDNFNAYGGGNSDGDKAYDGNVSTFTDADKATGGYTGLDLGSEKTISTIKFYPRSGLAVRLSDGKFQGSNDNSTWIDVYTINGTPASNWTSVNVNGSYRYMRYLSPANGYCNVAEIEFWGCSPQITDNTAINENSVSNILNMFPNPVKSGDILNIKGSENSMVEIHTLEGKLLYNNKLINNSLRLPASIKSGLYIVSIKANQDILMGKLIVE